MASAFSYKLLARGCGLLVLLWLCHACPTRAHALPPRRVVALLVPGLRADDLTRLPLPALTALRAEGAAGWMICRAAPASNPHLLAPDGRDASASLALTLGCGEWAVAGEGRREGETRRQGDKDTVEGNSGLVGALGELVHSRGWRTAVHGNADTEAPDDDGLLIAMDRAGRVDTLASANLTGTEEQLVPYGRRTDVKALLRAVRDAPARVAFIVLVFGDLARADQYAPLSLPSQAAAHRRVALLRLDGLLSDLQQQLSAPSKLPARLLLLSPAPAASTETRDRLAPILMWGRDVAPGTLTSPSTRLSEIVVNTDFLPTVADALGVAPPSDLTGRPFQIFTASHALTLAEWRHRHDEILQSERLKDVYGGLPTVQLLLVCAACALFRSGRRDLACALGMAIVALPLGMLLLPPVPFVSNSVASAGMALCGFVLGFSLLACYWRASSARLRSLFYALLAVLLGAIALDLLIGSPLLRQAWMSYSVMEAARFYGIGNEYMGVVIGAACILLGKEKKKRRKEEEKKRRKSQEQDAEATMHIRLEASSMSDFSQRPLFSSPLLLFFISPLLLFLLGYNRFGAKVGAVPSAGIAFGVELLMLWRGRLRARDMLALGGIAAALLGILLTLDMRHRASEQSHLARAFAGSGGGLLAIVTRKWQLEASLLLHSPWSAALFAATLGFVMVRIAGRHKEARQTETLVGAQSIAPAHDNTTPANPLTPEGEQTQSRISQPLPTTYGLVAGAIASLLCNDSGVTAAAMIMLFGFAWALMQANQEKKP